MIAISPDLKLPIDAITQTFALLAKRRAGKSYTARKFAEQVAMAGQQLIIIDPKGDWWGIRSAADAKGVGLPITILGGEHGDIPIEATGGELVAKLAVEQRTSLLLDLSEFRKNQVPVFMGPFLETLYRLKAQEKHRTPVMLIIDEADAIAPQKPRKDQLRMLGGADDIVRRGGQRGLGCMLVTQRSAVLNKDVLTQTEILVALRTIAPQDLAAMEAWFEKHGTKEERDILMDSLPSLPIGDAWFWSPGWPTDKGIFKRIHVAPIETFDSGASPKVGSVIRKPKAAAFVDLEALRVAMADTIQRKKADDPKELRRETERLQGEIAQLTMQLHASKTEHLITSPAAIEKARTLAVEQFKSQFAREMKTYERGIWKFVADARTAVGAIAADAAVFLEGTVDFYPSLPSLDDIVVVDYTPDPAPVTRPLRAETPVVKASAGGLVSRRPSSTSPNGKKLDRCARALLSVLAFRGARGATQSQLAILSGYSRTSSGFANALGTLRTSGLSAGRGDENTITDAGMIEVGDEYDKPCHGKELLNLWLGKLDKAERTILQALVDHRDGLSKDDLSEVTGYSTTSSGFANACGKLRTLELAQSGWPLRPSPDLFI